MLAAVRSKVLPEADVVLMNPAHPDAARVPPLVTRPFQLRRVPAHSADERPLQIRFVDVVLHGRALLQPLVGLQRVDRVASTKTKRPTTAPRTKSVQSPERATMWRSADMRSSIPPSARPVNGDPGEDASAALSERREQGDSVPVQVAQICEALPPERVPGLRLALEPGVDDARVRRINIGGIYTAEGEAQSADQPGSASPARSV